MVNGKEQFITFRIHRQYRPPMSGKRNGGRLDHLPSSQLLARQAISSVPIWTSWEYHFTSTRRNPLVSLSLVLYKRGEKQLPSDSTAAMRGVKHSCGSLERTGLRTSTPHSESQEFDAIPCFSWSIQWLRVEKRRQASKQIMKIIIGRLHGTLTPSFDLKIYFPRISNKFCASPSTDFWRACSAARMTMLQIEANFSVNPWPRNSEEHALAFEPVNVVFELL